MFRYIIRTLSQTSSEYCLCGRLRERCVKRREGQQQRPHVETEREVQCAEEANGQGNPNLKISSSHTHAPIMLIFYKSLIWNTNSKAQ